MEKHSPPRYVRRIQLETSANQRLYRSGWYLQKSQFLSVLLCKIHCDDANGLCMVGKLLLYFVCCCAADRVF